MGYFRTSQKKCGNCDFFVCDRTVNKRTGEVNTKFELGICSKIKSSSKSNDWCSRFQLLSEVIVISYEKDRTLKRVEADNALRKIQAEDKKRRLQEELERNREREKQESRRDSLTSEERALEDAELEAWIARYNAETKEQEAAVERKRIEEEKIYRSYPVAKKRYIRYTITIVAFVLGVLAMPGLVISFSFYGGALEVLSFFLTDPINYPARVSVQATVDFWGTVTLIYWLVSMIVSITLAIF